MLIRAPRLSIARNMLPITLSPSIRVAGRFLGSDIG